MSALSPVAMILIKRSNQRPHTDEELQWWIDAYTKGQVDQAQMAAWLMAVCFSGMTVHETATLTDCMVQSGQVVDWSTVYSDNDNVPCYLVDKHSTGGVGDKISLILAPLVASLGVHVPMMAGRGLGHTGGTIDKLESIEGYQTDLDIPKFQRIVQTVGCSIVAASASLAPADRKLYALRDVTGTVTSVPLQTASILCKKIAEHPHSLVLDCKYGAASFQSDLMGAQALAQSLLETAEANGLTPTTVLLTKMDAVLGTAVGNWVEVVESMAMLKDGSGSKTLRDLVVVQAAQMLAQSGKYDDWKWQDLVAKTWEQLQSGQAWTVFRHMVQAQGGNLQAVDEPEVYAAARTPKHVYQIFAKKPGRFVLRHGTQVGMLAVDLGAGRRLPSDPVDPMAGLVFAVDVGSLVQKGDLLVSISTNVSEQVLMRVAQKLEAEVMLILEPEQEQEYEYLLQATRENVITHMLTMKDGLQVFEMPECLR